MGHASDLPRQVILWFFSLFFPLNWLRQGYFFLCLLAGSLGVCFLLKQFILSKNETKNIELASTIGGVFYLLNLATIQTFYTPFSAFTTHFALIPWLFFGVFSCLKEPSVKNLILFVFVNLLAVPQAYVPTVFFVYFGSLVITLFIMNLNNLKKYFTRSVLVLTMTVIINAFWLFPSLYYIFTSSAITVESKINQMTTENQYLNNTQFGDLFNTLSLRGFWFNYTDFDQKGEVNYLLLPWRDYFHNFAPNFTSLFFVVLLFFGIFYAFQRKNYYLKIFLSLFFIFFLILANNTFPFEIVDRLLYKIDLFAQAFRTPFTKFSLFFAFIQSLFIGIGVLGILDYLTKVGKSVWIKRSIFSFIVILLVISSLPAFAGNLFYKRLKISYPNEYQQMYQFFSSQNQNSRIVSFPQQNFWGWNFYRFGYDGSGFMWYGLKQPIIDRVFDVWSRENENFFWESSYALYSKDINLFENVIEKYQVSWLIVDKNIIYYPSPKALYFDELEELLSKSSKIKKFETFGKIQIYEVNLGRPVKDFIYLTDGLKRVEPEIKWFNLDKAFLESGDYYSDSELPFDNLDYYPFRSLFTSKDLLKEPFGVIEEKDNLIIKQNLPNYVKNLSLHLLERKENLDTLNEFKTEINLINSTLEAKFPKIKRLYGSEIDPTIYPELLEAENCNRFKDGKVKNEIVYGQGEKYLRITALNATNCNISFYLPSLPHEHGYIITVSSKNLSGKPLLFWLENPISRKADIEIYLPESKGKLTTSYFIQPPMERDGVGYTLHFDSQAIGSQASINDLGEIKIYLIPYNFLTDLVFTNNTNRGETRTYSLTTKHDQPSLYEIYSENLDNIRGNLILSQAYHPGWKAFIVNSDQNSFWAPLTGLPIKNHVRVNNWENGWMLDDTLGDLTNKKIVIVFLPQYLEYVGFLLLLSVPLFFLYKYFKKNHEEN